MPQVVYDGRRRLTQSAVQCSWPQFGSKLSLSPFDLTIEPMATDAQGVRLVAHFNTELFDNDRINELLMQLQLLLTQAAANIDETVTKYSLLSDDAATKIESPRVPMANNWEGAVFDNLAIIAAREPDKIAIAFQVSVCACECMRACLSACRQERVWACLHGRGLSTSILINTGVRCAGTSNF